MEIFKESKNSELFLIKGIKPDQIIAFNDITANYRKYIEIIATLTPDDLKLYADGDPKKVKESLKLQMDTCRDFEAAFEKILNISKHPNPDQN